MPLKELPVLITPSIASDPDKLAKAVMRNFDHLIGEAGYTYDYVVSGDGLSRAVNRELDNRPDETDLDQTLNEAGVGRPDGAAPTVAPSNLVVTPGINYDLWLTWTPIANNSPVHFAVERKIGAAGLYQEAGETVAVPGDPDGHWQYHDTKLLLDTDYYYRVRAKDGDGYGPYSAETGPHRVNKTVNEQIADATINIATKVQGLLPQANLSTITDASKLADAIINTQATFDRIVSGAVIAGQHIVGGTIVSSKLYSGTVAADRIQSNHIAAGAITADKISVTDLAAINANIGAITAGSLTSVNIYSSNLYSGYIEGGTIQGATFRTAATGARVEMDSSTSLKDRIRFFDGTGDMAGYMLTDGTTFHVLPVLRSISFGGRPILGPIPIGTANSLNNYLELRNTAGTPVEGTSVCRVFYDASLSPPALRVNFPNGAVKTIATA